MFNIIKDINLLVIVYRANNFEIHHHQSNAYHKTNYPSDVPCGISLTSLFIISFYYNLYVYFLSYMLVFFIFFYLFSFVGKIF